MDEGQRNLLTYQYDFESSSEKDGSLNEYKWILYP
jgi:hypothetical protein